MRKTTVIRLCVFILTVAMTLPLFTFVATALEEDIKAEVKNTGLPVVSIDINDGSSITDRETYKEAKMHISLTKEYEQYTSVYTEPGGGDLEIKGRGNSSWWQFSTQKRAFNIKLDKKTELFGMDKSKKWCLIANFMDRSNLRNKLAYDLSGRMGMTYCESVFVNLYLNGTYMGVYLLCERADVDEEIYEWEDVAEDITSVIKKSEGLSKDKANLLEDAMKEDLSWITEGRVTFEGRTYNIKDYYDYSEYSLCGGYLIEYDHYFDQISKFKTANGVPLNLQSPEYLQTNDSMMNYLQNLFADFEEALWSESFYNSKGHHYSEYVDMDSLVDFFIVNAFFLNVEFGYKSNYLYIDETGIITFGPVWDFDWSSGNHFLGSSAAYDKWYGGDWRTEHNVWYHQLYGDPYFVSLVQQRWSELQSELRETIASIDTYYAYLNAASTYELEYYLALPNENDFRNQYHGYSFKAECDALKSFLTNRFNWMNSQLGKTKPSIEDRGPNVDQRMSFTLSGGGLVKQSSSYYDYSFDGESTDDLTLSFSLSSTAGVVNHFEIYVNGKYFTKAESQNFTLTVPCSLLENGINSISAVRIREGEYYGSCTYLTVMANISGKMVERDSIRISPAEFSIVNKQTLIEKESSWTVYTTTLDRFDRTNNTDWKSLSYNERNWKTVSAPLGDRLVPDNANLSGWKGDNHVLFARHKFNADPSALNTKDLYFDIYYDNTVYIYLNGNLIYSDDTANTGANDWTDSYISLRLSDVARYLVKGENILAVSLQDTTGGRELDLELYAVSGGNQTYKNPTADKVPEESVIEGDSSLRTFVTLSREDGGNALGLFVLGDKQKLASMSDAQLSLTVVTSKGNKTVTKSLSQLEELEKLVSDGHTFLPEEGYTLLGLTYEGIKNAGAQKILIKVTHRGINVVDASVDFDTVLQQYG